MADTTKTLREAADRLERAERTLTLAGYTDKGGELWTPPLGPSPSPLLERIEQLIRERDAALAAQAQAEPLFLLHTGAIDSGGEQDEWDTQANSWKAVEAFCREHPGQTVGLYPFAAPLPAAQPVADERDEEIERLRDLVIRQGTQLRRIVNIVRGDPAEGCAHSTHDAADLVYDLKMHSDQYAMAVEHEQRAAQPVADELRIARGAIRELEAKVFSQEQALAVLRASVDSYHRDMADPPGYLQDAVIRAAGLGAMAEQIAALKKAQPVRKLLTDERYSINEIVSAALYAEIPDGVFQSLLIGLGEASKARGATGQEGGAA